MRLFGPLWRWTMEAAHHRHAPLALAAVSAAESSFFPVPPDVMLVPMSIAKPRQAMRLAMLTTVASVIGGILGYGIGFWAFEAARAWLESMGYGADIVRIMRWYDQYGIWLVLLAGFSPIPYKLFTILSGAMALPFLPFVIASLVGRGGRFFLVAALAGRYGPPMAPRIAAIAEYLGWGVVVVALCVYLFMHFA